jgi:hypothetical protein
MNVPPILQSEELALQGWISFFPAVAFPGEGHKAAKYIPNHILGDPHRIAMPIAAAVKSSPSPTITGRPPEKLEAFATKVGEI